MLKHEVLMVYQSKTVKESRSSLAMAVLLKTFYSGGGRDCRYTPLTMNLISEKRTSLTSVLKLFGS